MRKLLVLVLMAFLCIGTVAVAEPVDAGVVSAATDAHICAPIPLHDAHAVMQAGHNAAVAPPERVQRYHADRSVKTLWRNGTHCTRYVLLE